MTLTLALFGECSEQVGFIWINHTIKEALFM